MLSLNGGDCARPAARTPSAGMLTREDQTVLISHFVNRLAPGGVTSVIVDLARLQQASGHGVDIVTLESDAWDERAISAGLDVRIGRREMARAVRSCDIVHSHHRRLGVASVGLGRASATVDHVHNLFYNHRHISFRGAQIIAVANNVATHIERTFPHTRGRVRIVHNGVSPPPTRRVHSLQGDQMRLAGVGRLVEQKNPEFFLTLIDGLRAEFRDVRAVWYGDGPLRPAFERTVKELGLEYTVEFVPSLDRNTLRSELAAADALLLTSRWEGLPIAAIEALGAGTPVCSTRCGEMAELLDSGGAGIVIDDEPRHAVTQIRTFLEANLVDARRAAAALFDSRFSLDVFRLAVDDVYASMI